MLINKTNKSLQAVEKPLKWLSDINHFEGLKPLKGHF